MGPGADGEADAGAHGVPDVLRAGVESAVVEAAGEVRGYLVPAVLEVFEAGV